MAMVPKHKWLKEFEHDLHLWGTVVIDATKIFKVLWNYDTTSQGKQRVLVNVALK